ncbi:MAG: hypothetical protein ACI8W8_004621 [Rhodothermales bacterium]|jgi:hypothetical protein
MRRHRPTYAGLIVLMVILGLASRSPMAELLPKFVGTYAGDTLWALMIFLLLGFVWREASTAKLATAAMAFAFGIELSQLYQADWINAIRDTRLGGLVLGFGFKWSDLLCYTLGCGLGVCCELRSSRSSLLQDLETRVPENQ